MKAGFKIAMATLVLAAASCNKGSSSNEAAFAPGAPIAPIPAPPGSDWSQVVSQTPEGGYRMGNPTAPVRLVEYASYGCPHCAAFSREATTALENGYVKSGRVSWEYRPFLLEAADPAVALLIRCKGAEASFLLAEQIYAQQPQWEGKLQTLSDAQRQQFEHMGPQQKLTFMVQTTGLDEFFRQRGMTNAQIDSCLSNEKIMQDLVDISSAAQSKHGVNSTPTFFINGQNADASTWGQLEPLLKRSIGE